MLPSKTRHVRRSLLCQDALPVERLQSHPVATTIVATVAPYRRIRLARASASTGQQLQSNPRTARQSETQEASLHALRDPLPREPLRYRSTLAGHGSRHLFPPAPPTFLRVARSSDRAKALARRALERGDRPLRSEPFCGIARVFPGRS